MTTEQAINERIAKLLYEVKTLLKNNSVLTSYSNLVTLSFTACSVVRFEISDIENL